MLAGPLPRKEYSVARAVMLPGEAKLLSAKMARLAGNRLCDVIFNTGATGLSPRGITPEATLAPSPSG